jgi:hypothetical protein
MTMKAKAATTENLRHQIELRAYRIWESEGRPHGREAEHWRRAEAEILGAKPAVKAKTAAKPKTKRARRSVQKG